MKEMDPGSAAESLPGLRALAERHPLDARPWLHLGIACHALRRLEEAEAALRMAIALNPAMAEAHNNLGVVLRAAGNADAAIEAYQAALALKPDDHAARLNLAAALDGLDRLDEAAAVYHAALAADPAQPEAWFGLGNVLTRQDRPEAAAALFRRVVLNDPGRDDALCNLGTACEAVAAFAAAEDCYRRTLRLRPDDASARLNLGLTLLRQGNFAEGWEAYEARWRLPRFGAPRGFASPEWDGRPLDGTLLLWAEQGLGDTLHFIRYVRRVRALCRTLVVECQPPLVRLLSALPEVEAVVPVGAALPPFDAHAPLLRLPRLLGTDYGTTPYLNLTARSGPDLPRGPGLNVGLVWEGSPLYRRNRARNLPFEALAPLLTLPGITFHSLHPGQTGPLAGIGGLGGLIGDMADTAALIRQLDLVIGVDTAVLHLAGALHRPGWLLLPLVADFRWGTEGQSSLWYPSLRLFRQRRRGDWAEVMERVRQALSPGTSSFVSPEVT